VSTLAGEPVAVQRRRLLAGLARRGYGADVAWSVVTEVTGDMQGEGSYF
jgi:hypothetical protein